ncbi:MAG: flagellar brake protein [Rhodocyclales bacterium]|nr:flagellar brake protein [Rhodocyclales bacterium]
MSLSTDENIESFTITTRREIVFYLRQLINDGERLNVMFDEGRETLLTVPLDVDEEKGLLIFDWGGSETVNQRLLKSPRTTFVANPLGVRNLFHTSRVWETTYKKRRAFATDIPGKYVRLQRREFFRLTLPMTQRRPCIFSSGEGEAVKQWQMSIVDIGLGGVGLESQEAALPFEFGQIISGAVIDLGKFGQHTLDMEVRFVGTVTRGHKQAGRLGCRFVKVRPAQETSMQQFVTQIQREERAKLG